MFHTYIYMLYIYIYISISIYLYLYTNILGVRLKRKFHFLLSFSTQLIWEDYSMMKIPAVCNPSVSRRIWLCGYNLTWLGKEINIYFVVLLPIFPPLDYFKLSKKYVHLLWPVIDNKKNVNSFFKLFFHSQTKQKCPPPLSKNKLNKIK